MQARVRGSARAVSSRRFLARASGVPRGSSRPTPLRSVRMYGEDVLKSDWRRRRTVPEVDAEPDLVVEDADSGFCGAVVGFDSGAVVLEDRFGKRRNFPLAPAAFLLDGQPVTLRRPPAAASAPVRRRTASGSIA